MLLGVKQLWVKMASFFVEGRNVVLVHGAWVGGRLQGQRLQGQGWFPFSICLMILFIHIIGVIGQEKDH
jgi:hypothetical protein